MKTKIIPLTVMMLLASIALVGPAAAQTNTTVSLEDVPEQEDVCMSINAETRICDYSIDDTTASVVIESDTRQSVTLTDAGGMMTGGNIRRESRLLTDGKNQVEFRVTKYKNFAGLTIDTGDRLFGLPLEERQSLLSGPITASDVQASALGGASAVALAMTFLIVRRVRGTDQEPEVVA